MDDPTLPLPGLSPVSGKPIQARFDGGMLSSDGGILVLREVEQRLGVAERLAGCIDDPRLQEQVVHSLDDMIRFRLMMIAAGYEDGNDATSLRSDPAFKLAQDQLPSGRDLASQPTISRLENLPDLRSLLHMGRALVNLYCASFRQVPGQIVLDVDDTFDAVHGGQQLRLFNAHHDEYGFQPIVVFDGDGRIVTAMLRPAKRPKGTEIRAFLRRLLRAIRTNWPRTRILIRADSHYCCPEVIDFCRANKLDFIFGVAPTSTLRRHIETLEASTAARYETSPGARKIRRFKEFLDGAESWSRIERIIARVEVGDQGADTRFIATNLEGGRAKALYEKIYCRRGAAENYIKSWKAHLAADRTSCTRATANQFRLFLHAGAYCWCGRPPAASMCQNEVVVDLRQKGPSVDQISRIGMDTSKHFFQLHGVNAAEVPVLRKKLRRKEMVAFFEKLIPTVIAIEACGGSHHIARLLQSFGHTVKLIAPQLVKPYVKRGKNDAADAEALCEAMSRPTMRFVPIKTAEQQAPLMLVSVRDRLIRNRTQLANAIRGYAAEFGLTAARGMAQLVPLLERIETDESLPALARELFALQADEYIQLQKQIDEVDRRLMVWHRADECSRRLAKIPGVGPIGAVLLKMKTPDPGLFQSGRQFAAWIGLTPKDHSTAGKVRLGVITRAGDEGLRSVLIVGATAVIRQVRCGRRASPWLAELLKRKSPKLAAVALANKMARIAWKLMVTGQSYAAKTTPTIVATGG